MPEQKHTSLPWKAVHFDGQGETASGQVQQVSLDGLVYNVAIFRKLEDAQLCIRACNSHYELLEAATTYLTWVGSHSLLCNFPDDKRGRCNCGRADLIAAIIKAAGEMPAIYWDNQFKRHRSPPATTKTNGKETDG